eukprot:6692464-Alexandrium_andersonii.AAC.1
MGNGEYVYNAWDPLLEFDPNSCHWGPLRQADPSALRQRFAFLPSEVLVRIRDDVSRSGGESYIHPRRTSLEPPEEEEEGEPEP